MAGVQVDNTQNFMDNFEIRVIDAKKVRIRLIKYQK